MKKIKYKVLFTFLISTFIFIVLSGAYNIFNLTMLNKSETQTVRELLLEDYDRMIKSEVETAVNIVNTYYEVYKEGKLSEQEAQEAAVKAIKSLRYNTDGYFWIDRTDGILIAHPIQPEQEGTNRIDIKDPNGVELIKEVVEASTKGKNSGYTNFMWEKPQDAGTGNLTPKRAYSQLFQPWNWIISTGNYIDDIDNTVEAKRVELNHKLMISTITLGVFIVVSLILMFIIGLIFSKRISDPIVSIVKSFERDSNGQISIQEIKYSSKDEIGLLAKTLNEMSSQMRSFINGVIQESNNVADSAKIVENHMYELSQQMEEVSATTQELSAGMEETAASTEEMNATATEIVKSVEDIAGKAEEGKEAVNEISIRAGNLKNNLNATVENANLILNEAKEKLDKAIEESKSVEQINELADAILQITEQTNLLALNAAIEAARAGEAGKGFAVVADEIRKLAEDSKNTAARIQNIIKVVNGSVDNLSQNSTQLLKFVSNDVRKDYDLMLSASDGYNTDAVKLDRIVSDFSNTAEGLQEAITNMMKAIEEITAATNEGALSTSDTSQRVAAVAEKSTLLLEQANKSKDYSENLKKLVLKFKL